MRASARTCIVLVTGLLASRPIRLRLADALPDREPQLDQAAPQRGERTGLASLQGVALPGRHVWLGGEREDQWRIGPVAIQSFAVVGEQLAPKLLLYSLLGIIKKPLAEVLVL